MAIYKPAYRHEVADLEGQLVRADSRLRKRSVERSVGSVETPIVVATAEGLSIGAYG